MSGFIDGVNKVFVLEHKGGTQHGSMHVEGFKTDDDAVAYLIYRNWMNVPDFGTYLEAWKSRIDEMLEKHNAPDPTMSDEDAE